MNILLVGFKLSVGNDLYMQTLIKNIKELDICVHACGDVNYTGEKIDYTCIGVGGSGINMIQDTLNVSNWCKYAKLIKTNKYNAVLFVSSHTLNIIAICLNRIFLKKAKVSSHIHDPYPHGSTRFSKIILFSNKIQAYLSDRVIVYGYKLKKNIVEGYGIESEKVSVITHGVYRKEINKYKKLTPRKYISLLGRIELYKGVDIFIKAADELLKKNYNKYSDIVFLLGGEGDLKIYSDLISRFKYKDNLFIINRRLSDEEFDDILKQSHVLVLPYYDGTQTGNIQVAYYNACPVIITNVGSLPELVIENETGFIIPPGSVEDLVKTIKYVLSDNKAISLENKCFEYYISNLRWSEIIKKLLIELYK